MSRFRHSSSFFIASALYALLGVSYLTLLNASKLIEQKSKPSVIKIAMVTPPVPKKVEKPIIVPPKPKVERPKPKPKPKKIVKKTKPKPKPKKIVKKVILKPKPVIEEVYEEPIVQEVIEKYKIEEVYQAPIVHSPPPMQQAVVATTPIESPTPQVDLEGKKRDFLNAIRANIYTNKKYPKMAKRRNIQGTVHALFDIQADGSVTNIRLSGASGVLEKAVGKSIERSFPASIPRELMGKFPMVDVSVNVEFILE